MEETEIRMYLSHIRRWVAFHRTDGGCWEWLGGSQLSRQGHRTPVVCGNKTHYSARRLVWEQVRSGVKIGSFVKTKCLNELCCNPKHLYVASSVRSNTAMQPVTHWFQTNDQGCWIWTGKRIKHGYGYVMIDGKRVLTHRRVWELTHNKPFPPGMVTRHTCDNPPCCRPDHLLIGTQRDNSRDMASRLRGPSKLSWADVEEIKRLRDTGLSFRKIAVKFKCTHKTIAKAYTGKTYSRKPHILRQRTMKILAKPTTPCWEWEGAASTGPYGQVKINGKPYSPHRRSWELMRGPIPKGMIVMHRCDNKRCFLIDHLELGRHQDNVDDWNGKLQGTHKIDFDTADKIRQLRIEQHIPFTQLGKQFDIDPTSVMRICRNELYVRPEVA